MTYRTYPKNWKPAASALVNVGWLGENEHLPQGRWRVTPLLDVGNRKYRFDEFELLSSEGELRTKDSCVRLQEKPLRLLMVLVENPQRVVTRDQLRERMWDSATFVDYEQGINVAIKKVRDALGDSAENPKFIETIAKKGYRFLVPVEVSYPELTAPAVAPAVSAPQPVASEPGASEATPGYRHSVRRRWMFVALAAGVLSGLGLWLFESQKQHRHSAPIHSLAVLPLRNLSPDSGQEYFADGITEELITDLAQLLPLRVISRTSAMRYKQTSEPITQIARELGVEAIVEGAVARSGNRVMVTVQLIDATEDRHLWAQKYDRNLGDLLGMEAELSQEIASQVGGTLSAQHDVKITRSHPVDPQVHDLCLMGRFHWNKRTAADLAKSADYYRQAIDRDPHYAPAYAGLANAYALLPHFNSVEMRESFAKADAAAHHALELDDTLAEAHATLGLIPLTDGASNWTQSEHEFRRALELNPNYATAHHWFAFYLFFSDRQDEALAEMEHARQLDPLSAIINADEGSFLYAARRYEEAKARLRQAIELAPDLGQPHETLALIDMETGHPSDALKEARTGLALDPSNPRTIGEAGYVLAANGQSDEARKLLTVLQDMVHKGSAYPIFAAYIHVGLGHRNEALDILEEMADPKTGFALDGLTENHIFDELSADSRYQKLLAQARERRISRSLPDGSAR
jgi:TolB-like protein/DNA-binding winged helix-turn-helix (wHTH) protein/Tfp pilus assembly protein PilF